MRWTRLWGKVNMPDPQGNVDTISGTDYSLILAMKQPNQPADIAREAIKYLNARKLPPTPDNYRRAYNEVAGLPAGDRPWAQTVRDLLREWDTYQAGLTQAKKREMLDRVLLNFGGEPAGLCDKLSNLARSWAESGRGGPAQTENMADEAAQPPAGVDAAPLPAPATNPETSVDSVPGLRHSLEMLADALAERWPDLAKRSRKLCSRADADTDGLFSEVESLWREVLLRAEDEHELLDGLQRVVGLLLENMASLVGEESWLQGQLTSMRALISGQLNYHVVFEAERGLQEIVGKQGKLKDNLQEAKEKLKHLITSFIDRIGEMSSSTGSYQERLAGYSSRISRAEDLAELADVVDNLSTDMEDIQSVLRKSHDDLMEARSHVVQAELRIVALEKELDQVSNLVREDQLTGAMNRRGLEETFVREAARAERMHSPLSLALLDLDHFKRLNDSLGHQAGDLALVHLAKVVRQLLRPTDTLSRWGGEEFLILLPNTDSEEATQVMRRLQRELTKSYFMHDHKKVLITFSAGVVEWQSQETRDQVIARADAAMYRAKAAGRNRVEQGF